MPCGAAIKMLGLDIGSVRIRGVYRRVGSIIGVRCCVGLGVRREGGWMDGWKDEKKKKVDRRISRWADR